MRARAWIIDRGFQVGGRLRNVPINGDEYEAGGSVIHEMNLYMKRFADELGEWIFDV